MDNDAARWAPQPVLVGLAWASAVAAGAGAALWQDSEARLLLAVAAAVLLLLALHGTIARPRLAADDAGMAVRGLIHTRHFEWHATRIRVRRTRHWGLLARTLELESGQSLVVLGRLDLGADPDDVALALQARQG